MHLGLEQLVMLFVTYLVGVPGLNSNFLSPSNPAHSESHKTEKGAKTTTTKKKS